MKRKQSTETELTARLEKSVERLLDAVERLTAAANTGREQIDRLAQLVNDAEDILKRSNRPGISIEGQKESEKCQPLYLDNEDKKQDEDSEFFVNYGFGHFVEFSSYEELKKFQKMPPISGDDIEACDFDDMIEQLLSEETEE